MPKNPNYFLVYSFVFFANEGTCIQMPVCTLDFPLKLIRCTYDILNVFNCICSWKIFLRVPLGVSPYFPFFSKCCLRRLFVCTFIIVAFLYTKHEAFQRERRRKKATKMRKKIKETEVHKKKLRSIKYIFFLYTYSLKVALLITHWRLHCSSCRFKNLYVRFVTKGREKKNLIKYFRFGSVCVSVDFLCITRME